MSSALYALNSAKNMLTQSNLRTLYYALLSPYIEYGISLWGSASKSNINPLYEKQKKAIRIITKANYNSPTQPLFKEQNIITLEDVFKLNVCKFMYDYHNHNLPNSLLNLFVANNDIHTHNTHHSNDPHIRGAVLLKLDKVLLTGDLTYGTHCPLILQNCPKNTYLSNTYVKCS